MYWKAPILGAFFLFGSLCGKQLAEPRDPECHEAVMLLFNAALIGLRSFASTVDVGLVPEGEQKASGPFGAQPFRRVPRG